MPSKNVIKIYTEEAYYHIYNRGVEKRVIFIDDIDYQVFLNLLKRHLSFEKHTDKRGNVYETYAGRVELLAFCLRSNHFHLLFYLHSDKTAITELLRKLSGTYTTYFNKKYKRVGHLLQGIYRASHISDESYLIHISRYIHLNSKDYQNWQYSSWPYYVKGWHADWIKPKKMLDLMEGGSYANFVADYKAHRAMLEDIKYDLADK